MSMQLATRVSSSLLKTLKELNYLPIRTTISTNMTQNVGFKNRSIQANQFLQQASTRKLMGHQLQAISELVMSQLKTRSFCTTSCQLLRVNGSLGMSANETTSSDQCKAENDGQPISDYNYKSILISRPSKHVIAIELNRPKVKNAFGLDVADEFVGLFKQLDADSMVRCVILSGNGPDFTSGVDLKSFMNAYSELQAIEDVAHRAKLLRNIIERFQAPFKQMYLFSKPIICVSHGLSLGLGIELAACSDIRYCSRDTKMAIREVLIGIAADVGSLQQMPRLVANRSLLNELIFTGRHLTVDEALQLGFVSRIFATKDEALSGALELAKTIASRSPVAVQGSKVNMRFSLDKSLTAGLDYNAVWNAAMMQGGDVVKAISSILSKSDSVDYDDF